MSIEITVNDRTLNVEKGSTILQAARDNGIYIPTLCAYPGLPSHGSCRMCIVEIAGRPNTPTACTTPVEAGMVIQTESPKVQALRGDLLKMLLSEHPSSCLFCPEKDHCEECMVTLRKAGVTTGCRSCAKDAQCELQEMVARLGLSEANYVPRYRMLPPEQNDPFFDRDTNLCVLCGRCVRVCEELHFDNVLAFTQRGTQSLVGTAFGRTHFEAGCTFCGACVEACPSGALSEKTRKWDGKPDAETLSTCPLCGLGCSLRILSKKGTVIGSLPDAKGALCVQGRFGITELVNHPTRLKKPLSLAEETQLEPSWEEAMRQAAVQLASCAPERFEMVVAPGCSREEAYVANKFARQVMHAAAADEAVFAPSQPPPLEALTEAGTIVCLGLDAHAVRYAQSVVEVALHRAKKRGAQLISLNSREDSLTAHSDVSVRVDAGHEAEALRALIADPAAVLGVDLQKPVFVVGAAFDTMEVREILAQSGAAVVDLGTRRGLHYGSQNADVLYCIGEDLGQESGAFVVYQNIYPPSVQPANGLILPAAAFTEQDGSLRTAAGRAGAMRKAVEPPGEALPGWQIVCRIAQAMGANGFDFASADEIRAEMGQVEPQGWGSAPAKETYLGFPLSRWVEGLQMLEGRSDV